MHLSWYGNRKLGHFVERELRRDIAVARAEREIPLAGTESEQLRLRQVQAARSVAGRSERIGAPGATVAKEQNGLARSVTGAVARKDGTPIVAEGAGLAQNNTRITLRSLTLQGKEEQISLEIVRPAIPGPVLASVTRRQSPDKVARLGDPVVTLLAGGAAIVSTVTPASETGSAERRAAGINAPHHLVLEKGQRLQPRPGRLDDLPWPRSENTGDENAAPSVVPTRRSGGADTDRSR